MSHLVRSAYLTARELDGVSIPEVRCSTRGCITVGVIMHHLPLHEGPPAHSVRLEQVFHLNPSGVVELRRRSKDEWEKARRWGRSWSQFMEREPRERRPCRSTKPGRPSVRQNLKTRLTSRIWNGGYLPHYAVTFLCPVCHQRSVIDLEAVDLRAICPTCALVRGERAAQGWLGCGIIASTIKNPD
jgi:hypothetical protein